MYKVFVFDKLIILSGEPVNDPKYQSVKQVLAFSKKDLKAAWTDFINDHSSLKLVLYNNGNSERLLDDFISLFWYVEAAGGMVYNTKGERLFIHRFGKWDLPKGKIEKNETKPEAALREVREETGLNELEIINELPSTFHIFDYKGKKVLKRTYWFKMLYSGNSSPMPQIEEEIVEAIWIADSEIQKVLSNTYASLRELID